MVAVAKPVGENRTRESAGRYFEEFEVGAIYEHRPGRTISEADNTWFTLLTMNQHPLHFDVEYAKKSEFGRPLVNSCLTLSMACDDCGKTRPSITETARSPPISS